MITVVMPSFYSATLVKERILEIGNDTQILIIENSKDMNLKTELEKNFNNVKVIIPKENEKDLADIPDNVKKGLELIFVDNVDEVLKIALTKPLIPIEWDEQETIKSSSDLTDDDADQDSDNPITH